MPDTISSRTPEGDGYRCPICGKVDALRTSAGSGDSVCPSCGHLLWWFRDRLGESTTTTLEIIQSLELAADEIGKDSLDLVELVMELEEELDLKIPREELERCRTIKDVIRLIRRHQDGEAS